MATITQGNALAAVPSSLNLNAAPSGSISPINPPRSPAAGTKTTSTSVVASRSGVRRRKQTLQPLDPGNARCFITSTYGQTLEDESLVLVAQSLLRMEDEIVSIIAQQLRLTLSKWNDAETQIRLEQELKSLSAIKIQTKDIQLGKAKIHSRYLVDEHLLRYWEEAHTLMVHALLWDPQEGTNHHVLVARLKRLEYQGGELVKYLRTAAVEGWITAETRYAVHQKWAKFDRMINAFHQELGTERKCPEWPLTQDSHRGGHDSAKRAINKDILPTLWWIFGVASATGMIFTGVAIHYSSNEAGHLQDPDFWSSLQSMTLQLCALAIIGRSFREATTYDWLFGSAGACCSVLAPILYLRVPTQYSMCSSAISGVFQALLILQHSVSGLADDL